MLTVLLEFVDKYPQREGDSFNYIVFGGAAVRVLEEAYRHEHKRYFREPPRIISDVDLLVINPEKSYPVHSTTMKDVFNTGIRLSLEDLLNNVNVVNVVGREVVVPNKELLIASKSLSIQTTRMKDYDDIALIYSMGIDKNRLAKLFEKCLFLPKAGGEFVSLLEDALAYKESDKEQGYRFFANVQQRINVLFNFPLPERKKVSQIISSYIGEDLGKDGYQISRVLQDVASVLVHIPNKRRKKALSNLFSKAENLHYTEFDILVHYKFIPALMYSRNDSEKIDRLKEFKLLA